MAETPSQGWPRGTPLPWLWRPDPYSSQFDLRYRVKSRRTIDTAQHLPRALPTANSRNYPGRKGGNRERFVFDCSSILSFWLSPLLWTERAEATTPKWL